MSHPTLAVRFSDTTVPGRPVVLVHGIISGRYLVPLARALADSGPVHLPELPGFGDTPPRPHVPGVPDLADALAGWLGAQDLDRPMLVGHSTGCQVVIDLLARRPDLAGAAVLIGPTGDPRARTVRRHYGRWMRCQLIEPWSFTGLLTREFIHGHVLHQLRVFRKMMRDPVEEKAPRVGVPALVVRGARDHVAPAWWTQRLATLLPDGRSHEIPGASHTLRDQDPAIVADLLRRFAT